MQRVDRPRDKGGVSIVAMSAEDADRVCWNQKKKTGKSVGLCEYITQYSPKSCTWSLTNLETPNIALCTAYALPGGEDWGGEGGGFATGYHQRVLKDRLINPE
jgi:hypothetical protein